MERKFSKGFWQLADPKIWIASTVPMIVGSILAYSLNKTFDIFVFILALIGVYLIEIGKNAINEYTDYVSGVDKAVDEKHRTPFSGGKKTIVDGLLTTKDTLVISATTFFFAGLIGLYMFFLVEPKIIYIGILGFLSAALYSLPPFKLCYRGFGEILVGITFGPLILNGMYLVLAHRIDFLPILVSIPIGLIITNVLWINQFPDYEADLSGNKKNWVVRLGKEKSIVVYGSIFTLAYISVIIITLYSKNYFWLLPLITIPIAYKSVTNAAKNFDNIPKLIYSNKFTIIIYQLLGLLLCLGGVSQLFY